MEEVKDKKIDKFCHLHLHSSYSFTDGYGLPEQYIQKALEIGQPGLGVTDHGNISSHLKWYKQCNKAGIKPILGVEFYIVENEEDIRGEKEYAHITVLAKNLVGYRNLTTLLTKAWCEQFYYKPRITFQNLFDQQEGLVVLSGCLTSPVMKKLKENRIKEAEELIELFNSKLDDFYIEVQPISFKDGLSAYQRLLKLYNEKWKSKGMKLVATNDCHYVKKEQSKVQEILLCVQTRDVIYNKDHWKFDQDDFYLKTREEMQKSLNDCHPDFDFTEALDNTVKIMESIDFVFPKADPIKFPMPDNEKEEQLRKMCNEGFIKRELKDKNSAGIEEKIYRERLEYEIDLIIKKNFIDYFLVISDLVNWAKNNGILVGPARGSAAGSLACYVLAITEVEPIRYGLIFERFIDLNREDLPDIDLDFEDTRRHEVKAYLEQKYGRDKVGNLPVFAAFKGKSAIDDVGRVFKIPFSVLEKVKNAIIERSGGDSRASFTLEDTFISDVFEYPKIAMKEYPNLHYAIELEGQFRQMGQHAAGVVISNNPLTDVCAIYKIKDSYVISMEYKDASDSGLLKIDLLGLNTLSVISHTTKLIKERHNKEINVYNLTLDDPKVYQGFCDGKLFGIFQFDGQAVNQVCRQIKPRDFDSLSAISALARPGPLNCLSGENKIKTDKGVFPIQQIHKRMENGEKFKIIARNDRLEDVWCNISKSYYQGRQQTFTLKTETRLSINATLEHRFLTTKGWKKIKDLKKGDCILINGDKKRSKIGGYREGHKPWNKGIKDFLKRNLKGKNSFSWKGGKSDSYMYEIVRICLGRSIKKGEAVHHINGIHTDNRPSNMVIVNKKEHDKLHMKYRVRDSFGRYTNKSIGTPKLKEFQWFIPLMHECHHEEKIVSIKPYKISDTYDFLIDKFHNYEANQFIVHNSGSTTLYIQRRSKREKVEYPHPVMKPFTEETYGIVVYQEQVMKTMREVGKMSWKDTSEIRKLISRSQGVEKFNTFKEKFAIGAKDNGMNTEQIDKIWDSICTFGSWAFNKSHSVSYTLISYWTMWLKIHYPLEFYSSIMALTESEDKNKKIVKECKREGLKLLPIDVNKSKEHFSIDETGIRIGFGDIKGIGSKTSSSIVKHQPYYSYSEFIRKNKKVSKISQNLIDLGTFDSIGNKTVQTTLFGDYIVEYTKNELSFEKRFSLCPWDMEFGLAKNWIPFINENSNYFREKITNIEELKEMDNAKDVVICGIVYDKNLRDAREVSMSKGKGFDKDRYKIIHLLNKELIKWYKGNEWISQWALKNYTDKTGKIPKKDIDYKIEEQYQFANFVVEDDTDFITVRMSPVVFPMYGKLIFEQINTEDPVVIKGKMGSGIRMFFANKILSLKQYKESLDYKNSKSKLKLDD